MTAKIPAITIYANLMDEAKARIAAIKDGVDGKLDLPAMVLEEFSYLQLRLLCEIVALGCLVAHGDFTQMTLKKLHDKYEADEIIKRLDALNPTFYPIPVKMHIKGPSPSDPAGSVHLEEVPSEMFLTKAELLTLYGRTGNYLHRGKLRKLQSRPPYTAVNPERVVQWASKIVKLLDQHRIRSPDNKKHWLCALKGPDGNVMMALALSP